ncbi:hypothetical protein ABIF34_008352 [Bradyrhizobium japonicum]
MELMHGRREGALARKHLGLRRGEIALAQITGRARRDHVLPGGLATLAARDDVIEGEIFGRAAILAGETIAQEDVEPGEGGVGGRLDEGFERDHARQLHFQRGTSDRLIVMRDDVDAVEEHRLDRVLPRPQRQWVVTQRPEVRIQHQHRPTALRDMCVQVTLPASMYAAKQHVLTYYMQRDGIVKPVERLIQSSVKKPD